MKKMRQVGETTSDASVVAELSRIVTESGGVATSKPIDAEPDNVGNAVDQTRRCNHRLPTWRPVV